MRLPQAEVELMGQKFVSREDPRAYTKVLVKIICKKIRDVFGLGKPKHGCNMQYGISD